MKKKKILMDSLRRIFLLSAIFKFRLKAVYYPGDRFNIGDAVSRLYEPIDHD